MEDSWLKPNGVIIEVGMFNHNKYANNILIEEFGGDYFKLEEFLIKNRLSYPYEALHLRGWIRIKFNSGYLPRISFLGNCIDLTKPMINTMNPAMNDIQLKIAKRLCEEYNTEFHVAINDKRFW